jgi:TetR/AcrR family transcriptional repressor of bet genes
MAAIPSTGPRKASKDFRRNQLIEATIGAIARKGYAAMTLADVARAAGMSGGIVNFHFESKEKLLIATLRHLAGEYRQNWQQALKTAGACPAARLAALATADFNDVVCTPDKLAAWSAFWAEAQNRPTYMEHCGANDAEFHVAVRGLVAEIIADGGYEERDAGRIARALDALLEGLWLDLITAYSPVTREEAVTTVYACLCAFFPRHFSPSGLRDKGDG